MIKSRYPNHDVMASREEWDEHTRHVIDKRMAEAQPPQFFTPPEADALRAALARLLAEDDPWLIAKVLEHIDGTIAHGTGEGYRPEWQAPEQEYWRSGVASLGPDFVAAPGDQQDETLRLLQQENPDFFRTLLTQAVTGYCSLPPVWSFMGYGGPAFPRGYVRIELGLRDPWEAKPDAE
ncbi:MAG TPA: gluconate 2-dehydrogenase subunit 3 family protein [Symbiobacteriaceae bacterium]|nr:gluconate 2-dehydrogenase subunit 3 family protein [Symbiobacteriaceae bacterium]